MYCQHCGHKNNSGAKFCEACGRPTAVAAVTPLSGGTANTNLKILALVALIAVAAVVVWIVVGQVGGSMGGLTEGDIAFAIDQNQGKVLPSDITIVRKVKCALPDIDKAKGYREKWIVSYIDESKRRLYGWTQYSDPQGAIFISDGYKWVVAWVGGPASNSCPRLE